MLALYAKWVQNTAYGLVELPAGTDGTAGTTGEYVLFGKYYINNAKLLRGLNILAFVLMAAIVIGRVLSGVHWASDILGGMIISIAMLSLLKCGIIETEEKS